MNELFFTTKILKLCYNLRTDNNMNEYLSHKLKIISFIAIIFVVIVHSSNLHLSFTSGDQNFQSGYNMFIQYFFSRGITRVASPIFFCISGYLFFLNFKGTKDEFKNKYRKRARSVLLPYLLWSLWGIIFYFVLQQIPQSKNFFTRELIADYSVNKILHTLFINPIPYQLWFLRDLIILIIISPLIYWLIKHFNFIPLIVFFVIWFGFFGFKYVIFRNDSILFFSLGAYISLYHKDILIKKLDKYYYLIFAFLWFLLVAIKTVLLMNNELFFLRSTLQSTSVLVGIIALWSAYDIIMKNIEMPNQTILNLCSFTFIIYVFHEPVLTIINKGLFYIFGTSELKSLIIYFISPALIISISILLGYILKKNTPKFYAFINGKR